MIKSLRNPWWIVVGSVLGLMVGNGPIMQFSFGVFVKPVSQALQIERGTVSAALMAGLLMTGLATPIAGRLVDRYGIRRVALPAIALFGAGMAAIGLFANSAWSFIALYALAGIAAAGQTPMTYCKAVSSAFDSKRGLALGISIAGVGVGTALIPQLAQALLPGFGWRGAYVALGAVTVLVALPAMYFLVGGDDRGAASRAGEKNIDAASGLSASEALRSGAFWLLAVSFFLVAFAANGVIAHVVPLMADRGIEARAAAAALGAAGLALIGGRLLAGYLLDHWFAPWIAMVFFALPVAGIALLLGSGSAAVGLPAAVLIGLGLGAEVDLIAYLQSRYLGIRSFGEIYGYLFAVFMLGSATGPFVMGMSHQQLHGYAPALTLLLCGLLVAIGLMTRLGAYRYGKTPERSTGVDAANASPVHQAH